MHISDEGLVAGSVNRAELAAAYAAASDRAVRENLAAVGAENGMHVKGGRLVDPSAPEPQTEPDFSSPPIFDVAGEGPVKPVVADNKATWVDWAISQGAEREDAEAATKAELIELYGTKE